MRWILTLAFFFLVACTGTIGDPGSSLSDPNDPNRPGGPDGPVDLASCRAEASVAPTTRLARLSHAQLANSVRDLLLLDEVPSEPSSFITDVGDGGFDNNGARLTVAPALGRDYQRLAERLSAEIAADADAVTRISPCEPSESDCDSMLVDTLGRRAYRRPLSDTERANLLTLFRAGPELVGSGDAFGDGVQVLIEALLQSPNFLYRVERTTGEGEIRLDSWEVATRLSYALWGTMPDDVLFAAAEADELGSAELVRAQADRMLSHPNSAAMLEDFHRQLLALEYGGIARDPSLNPAWDDNLAADLAHETQLFVRDVILDERGTIRDLFTSNHTFVNDQTAAIYGDDIVSDPGGEGFRRVELDPARRAGILTQLGFLAGNAYFAETDPIHRGVHLHRKILCSTLPDPPDDVPTNLPPASEELRTTRERVEFATSSPSCQGCHRLINEPGFAFENYDAIGQFRTDEDGVPVDTAGEIPVDGDSIHFEDAVGLSGIVSESTAAAECYTRHFFRYAHARSEGEGDCDTLSDLSQRVRDEELTLRELIVELVVDHSFLHRTDEE